MKPVRHSWNENDLIGGDPAVNFANTVSDWCGDVEDWLVEYAGLAGWARLSGLITQTDYKKAMRSATSSPSLADSVYADSNELRVAFLRLVHSARKAKPAKRDDMAVINHWIGQAAAASELRQEGHTFRHVWSKHAPAIQRPLLAVAQSIGRFLEEGKFDGLKMCAAPKCGWLFIDRSKSRRRRWCDMTACGNRAKARRFRARKHKALPGARSGRG